MIPPEEDAAFVKAMENVLDLYQKPLDTEVLVVNRDEQSVTLRDHIRAPQPAKPGQVERVDSEYKRNGTASVFLFTEALFQGFGMCLLGSVAQRKIGHRR